MKSTEIDINKNRINKNVTRDSFTMNHHNGNDSMIFASSRTLASL